MAANGGEKSARFVLLSCLTARFDRKPLCLCGGERVKGIEPSYAAWEAAVLPLNYTRVRVANKRDYCQETMSSDLTVPLRYVLSPLLPSLLSLPIEKAPTPTFGSLGVAKSE